MSNPLEYFQLTPKDVMSSESCDDMTTTQFGAYWLILFRSWMTDTPGYLPVDGSGALDEGRCAKWARLSADDWKTNRGAIMAAFKQDENGRYYQPRMLAEYQRCITSHQENIRLGKIGASKRWDTEKKKAEKQGSNGVAIAHPSKKDSPPIAPLCPPYSPPIGMEMETETVIETGTGKEKPKTPEVSPSLSNSDSTQANPLAKVKADAARLRGLAEWRVAYKPLCVKVGKQEASDTTCMEDAFNHFWNEHGPPERGRENLNRAKELIVKAKRKREPMPYLITILQTEKLTKH